MSGNNKWSETVILVDADYADRVAFDLIVNFERMLERRIPAADLPRWLDCLALDGGVRPADEGKGEIQAIFLHAKERLALENFVPAHFERDLNGQAFRDNRSAGLEKPDDKSLPYRLFLRRDEHNPTSADLIRYRVMHRCYQSVRRESIIQPGYVHILRRCREYPSSGKHRD